MVRRKGRERESVGQQGSEQGAESQSRVRRSIGERVVHGFIFKLNLQMQV